MMRFDPAIMTAILSLTGTLGTAAFLYFTANRNTAAARLVAKETGTTQVQVELIKDGANARDDIIEIVKVLQVENKEIKAEMREVKARQSESDAKSLTLAEKLLDAQATIRKLEYDIMILKDDGLRKTQSYESQIEAVQRDYEKLSDENAYNLNALKILQEQHKVLTSEHEALKAEHEALKRQVNGNAHPTMTVDKGEGWSPET